MKLSAIEIGTNSIKYIIADVRDKHSIVVIEKGSIVNRLSKGMYGSSCICDEAMENGIKVIGEYVQMLAKKESELVSIFSTSVLRDAVNGRKFIDAVKDLYGINIEVISGDKEGYLAYRGCGSLMHNKTGKFAVIDIGGGSTEITKGSKNSVDDIYSIDIGAVRLTDIFVKHDPIDLNEMNAISSYVSDNLVKIECGNLNGIGLVGTGGTIKSIGTIYMREGYKNEEAINGITMRLEDISSICSNLTALAIKEKQKLIGLNPKRADVIVSGIIILLTVMRHFNIDKIMISSRGVLEGFIEDYRISPNGNIGERKNGTD